MKTTLSTLNFAFFALLGLTTCTNGENIPESTLLVEDPMIRMGLQWLWLQRDPSYGFKDLTAKAVTVLQLANASTWYSSENLNSLVAVKQMEVELLVQLSRHHEVPTVPSEIAEYSLALSSLCIDPRQFHGFDLIGILRHHQLLLDWELALTSLAECTSGAHVRKNTLRRLLDATEAHENLSIDTLSMVLIALNCIVHDHRNRNLAHYLAGPTKILGHLQKTDGSFGNFKSTAIAVQALQAADPKHLHWNEDAAIGHLRSFRQEDGSYGENKDLEATMAALLALGPRSLANIKDLDCHKDSRDEYSNLHLAELTLNLTFEDHNILDRNHTVLHPGVPVATSLPVNATAKPVLNNPGPVSTQTQKNGNVVVSYTLWVENKSSTVNISTEPGSSFYHVMQLAAEKYPEFAFESTEWPNGHYIHTLSGFKEDPMTYRYWLLYKLPAPARFQSPPTNQFVAPFGVDDLKVNSNDIYLFWFKKL